MIRRTLKIILFFSLLAFQLPRLFAQDVFLSISGQSASSLSGASSNYHDYWLKQTTGAKNAVVKVYDAGINRGTADVVYGTIETQTSYELYPASALYQVIEDSLVLKSQTNAKPLSVLNAGSEPIYKERWQEIGGIQPRTSKHGFILRVRTSQGNDVNAFKILIADSETENRQSKNWAIVSFDLSLGLYNFSDNLEVQLAPFNPKLAPQTFSVLGEESAILRFRDDFGNTSSIENPQEFWKPERNGVKNHWGLGITKIGKNNHLSVTGTQNSVMWIINPKITKRPSRSPLQIQQLPGSNCQSVRLRVNSYNEKPPIWIFNNEKFSGDSVEIEFGTPGDYKAEVWAPTNGLYFPKYWIHPFDVHINTPPKAVISYDALNVSPGKRVTLSAIKSSDIETKNLTYAWFVDGALRSRNAYFPFSSNTTGKFNIELRVSDNATNSSCTSASDSVVLTINTQPFTDIRFPKEFARNETVVFVAEKDNDPDGDSLSYYWKGSGIQSDPNERAIEVQHNTHGIYYISQTVSDNLELANSTYTKTVSYRVNAEPVPRFNLPSQAAPNDVLRLSALPTSDADDQILAYAWKMSDGQKLKGREVEVRFSNPGDYTISLTVDDGHEVKNSVQFLTKNIHINAPPVPRITAPSRSTEAKIAFSAKNSTDSDSKDLSYYWDFGDGNKAKGLETVHTYQKSGSYTITLTVNDGENQTNSVQKTTHNFRLFKYPVAKFTSPGYAEPNRAFQVDASQSFAPDGKIKQYQWLIDGKVVASGKTADLKIATSGDHIIGLIVQDDSGFEDAKSLVTRKIHINHEPVPRSRISKPVAAPNQWITFNAGDSYDPDGRIDSYTWHFSDGDSQNGKIVRKKFSKPGRVEYSLIVDDGTGFNNAVQQMDDAILINSTPIIVSQESIRTNSRRIKLDASESYDVDKQALNFEWILPDGSKRQDALFYWDAPKEGGVFFFSLNVDDGQNLSNSRASHTLKVLVNRAPIAVVDTLVKACTGQTILFNGSRSYDPDGDPLKLSWDFGDSTTSNETDPAHVYNKPGEYTVSVKLDDGFSLEPTLATIPVIIGSSPLAVQSFKDTTVCVQKLVEFDGSHSEYASGIIGSYAWDFGDGETALGKVVKHSYSKPGVYKVILTVLSTQDYMSTSGCSKIGQSSSTVRVIAGPVAKFEAKAWLAIGERLQLDASGSEAKKISSAEWRIQPKDINSGDSTIIKQGIKTSHAFSRPGLYDISLTITDEGKAACNTAGTLRTIRVNASPILKWNVPNAVALGDQVVLDASSSYDPDGVITAYKWTLDGKQIGETPTVLTSFSKAGSHKIELSITDNSPTKTNRVSVESAIFVNTSPKPKLDLPEKIYEYELVTLLPEPQKDADGDKLSFRWRLDGVNYVQTAARFTAGRHTIQLMADDNRGLANSKDSIYTEINVIASPKLEPDFPQHILIGETLYGPNNWKKENIGFVSGNTLSNTYKLTQTGKVKVKLGWAPKGEILKEETLALTVWQPLEFSEKPAPITLTWNPANPTLILTAPDMNRPVERKPQYRWKRGSKILGYGQTQEVRLYKGRNTFTVEAYEPDVQGSKNATIEMVVITE